MARRKYKTAAQRRPTYFKGKGNLVWKRMVRRYGKKQAGAYFYGTVNKMRQGSKAQRAAQPKRAPGKGVSRKKGKK